MNDLVLIHGLKLPVLIGCLPGERDRRQDLELNLSISVKQNDCVKSGDPKDTVCYATVCKDLKKLTENGEWPLLEQLAEDISKEIFQNFPSALEVRLEVRKFVVPEAEWTGIRVRRRRIKHQSGGKFGFARSN